MLRLISLPALFLSQSAQDFIEDSADARFGAITVYS